MAHFSLLKENMFSPDRVLIANITQANPAVVTTTTNHNMTTGQVVRIHVPIQFGMTQLNQVMAQITVLSATTFSLQYTQVPNAVNINSTNFSPFVSASNTQFTAEILPIGSSASPLTKIQYQITNGICVSSVDDATHNISTTPVPF